MSYKYDEDQRAANRARYLRNRKAIRAYQCKYRAEHREELTRKQKEKRLRRAQEMKKVYDRARYEKNRERIIAASKRYACTRPPAPKKPKELIGPIPPGLNDESFYKEYKKRLHGDEPQSMSAEDRQRYWKLMNEKLKPSLETRGNGEDNKPLEKYKSAFPHLMVFINRRHTSSDGD